MDKNPDADLKGFLSSLSEELHKKIIDNINEWKKNKNNNEETSTGGYNFQDFQKRLIVMKQRYGLTSSNHTPELSTTLTDLKAKVSTILNKPVEDQNSVAEMKSKIQRFKNT